MAKVIIYTKSWCGYCKRAKNLLDKKNVAYEEVDVSKVEAVENYIKNQTGWKTVPQIFINDKFIGGCDELYDLEKEGLLENLLKE